MRSGWRSGMASSIRLCRHSVRALFLTENFSYNHGQHAWKVGGSIRPIRDTQVQATAANYTFPNVAAYLAARDGLRDGFRSLVATAHEYRDQALAAMRGGAELVEVAV